MKIEAHADLLKAVVKARDALASATLREGEARREATSCQNALEEAVKKLKESHTAILAECEYNRI